ncbi:MAG: OB-fold domain-containing protein [Rhizomicrobium sp.]
MIGKLSGRIDTVAEDHVLLDVGGVGYLVHCPASTLSKLAPAPPASLMIEPAHHRRDDPALWVFRRRGARMVPAVANCAEHWCARGAQRAVCVVARELERALALSDKAAIGRAQGVGQSSHCVLSRS